MSDIATIWSPAAGSADWLPSSPAQMIWTDEKGNSVVDQHGVPISAVFTAGEGLVSGNDLMTAVLISIFTDAEASPDDIIPDGSDDPRGWWGGPIGSKVWLRLRSKATPLVLATVQNDIQQSLAWLVENDVCARVDVLAEWTRPTLLGIRVLLLRNDGTRHALAFSRIWETI